MYSLHIFVDGELFSRRRLKGVPRKGETLRLEVAGYVTVREVVWCLDEDDSGGQRINLACKTIPTTPKKKKGE